MHTSTWEHGVRTSCVGQFFVVSSVTFGTWLWNVHSMCVNVLCCQRNVACCVIVSGFGRRWSMLLQIYQSNCEQEAAMLLVVISLQTATQKAIFSTQPRRSTKRVSWSRVPPVCQHRSIFASTLAYMEQSSAELRAHINWLMRECPRIRDYTRASRSLCRCAIKIDIYLLTYCQTEHVTLRPWTWSSWRLSDTGHHASSVYQFEVRGLPVRKIWHTFI